MIAIPRISSLTPSSNASQGILPGKHGPMQVGQLTKRHGTSQSTSSLSGGCHFKAAIQTLTPDQTKTTMVCAFTKEQQKRITPAGASSLMIATNGQHGNSDKMVVVRM